MDKDFTERLLAWFDIHGRHDLPWQKTSNWYTRILSEVMLQQTQVKTVIPYFEKFLNAYPTPEALAHAHDEDVMALWAGLGYYSRARNLLKAIRTVVFDYEGRCPQTAKALAELPGIGLSTAGAVSSSVFGERAVMADGNAKRVICRVWGIPGYVGQTSFEKAVWAKAEQLLPASERMADYTQALMDIGALLCKRRPECDRCPMQTVCDAYASGSPTDFPAPKPKKVRPIRYARAFFLVGEEQCWVLKKQQKGVWEGLWLPPLVESDDKNALLGQPWDAFWRPALRERMLEAQRAVLPQMMWPHDFSHYRLEIYPSVIELKPGCVPVGFEGEALEPLPFKALDRLGLPSPIRKLLDQCVLNQTMDSLFSH